MTKQEYRQKILDIMSKFVEEIHNPLVDLTVEFKKKYNGNYDEIFYPDDQRKIDQMALTSAWLEDRLNGLNGLNIQNSHKSRTKKIRKALGYTF